MNKIITNMILTFVCYLHLRFLIFTGNSAISPMTMFSLIT